MAAERARMAPVLARRVVHAMVWALVLAGLGYAAARNEVRLNSDAVAYLRLAQYYATGRPALAISAYWGPLLSWLCTPLLWVGVDPLAAARMAMAFCGGVFVFGGTVLVRNLRLGRWTAVAGTAVFGLFAIVYSVTEIAPDLLLAGLYARTGAELLAASWVKRNRSALRAGFWLGLTALAKPSGLPMGLAMLLSLVWMWRVAYRVPRGRLVRRTSLTLLAAAVFAGPWLALVVMLNGEAALGRPARMNHALVNPDGVVAPEHPATEGFREPPPGRLTLWENPTGEGYSYWSPFDSWTHLRRQAGIVRRNFREARQRLHGFDWLQIGFIVVVVAFFLCVPWRTTMRRDRWRWAALPVFGCIAVHLPVYADQLRYFYAAFPFVFACVAGMALWLARGRRLAEIVLCVCVVGIFAKPSFKWLDKTLEGKTEPAVAEARAMAARLREAGMGGESLAGDRKESLYLTFLAGGRWYGYRASGVTVDDVRASGATLFCVTRDGELDRALADAEAFRDLGLDGFASRIYALAK